MRYHYEKPELYIPIYGAVIQQHYDQNEKYTTIRQIIWALKIKPIKKERWETVFDRKSI